MERKSTIIAGAVTESTASALLVLRAKDLSEATARAEAARVLGGGAASNVSVARVVGRGDDAGAIDELIVELGKLGVFVFRADVAGATSDSPLTFVVDRGSDESRATLRTMPEALPPAGMNVLLASCFFNGYGRDDSLVSELDRVSQHAPIHFGLWVGDNVYLDVPSFARRVGAYDGTAARYVEYFLHSKYGLARARHATFSTVDDHEFWNNAPGWSPWLWRTYVGGDAYFAAAKAGAWLFGGCLNPGVAKMGDAYSFTAGGLSFFVADLRSRRRAPIVRKSERQMLDDSELERLETWAKNLTAPGVLVLGQPLWLEPGSGLIHGIVDRNPAWFGVQCRRIVEAVFGAPYDILVLSGDIHTSVANKLRARTSRLTHDVVCYEVVSSPCCHIPTNWESLGPGAVDADSQGSGTYKPLRHSDIGGFMHEKGIIAHQLAQTNAQNTFAMLRFARDPAGDVAVSVDFRDHGGAPGSRKDASTRIPFVLRRRKATL